MPKTFDIRTYVTLEKALTNRLIRDWQKRSASIYEAITAACVSHQWDKARQLVPDLDLTETGTENKEWIKFLLRSCAVFGAGMVSKKEPSFVAVGSFDTTLNKVTSTFLTYLELKATSQVQAQALQLIAEDEQKTKIQKKEHQYGNTQVNIDPDSDAAKSLRDAKYWFQSKDLMGEGVDETNHVTVRYGVENDDVDELRDYIASLRPFDAELDGVMLFETSEHSEGAVPVVARVVCPTLHFINKEIEHHADFKKDSFGVYRPHCTLAYCKPEAAQKYLDLQVSGKFHVDSITISHKNGVMETIPFGIIRKFDEAQHPRDKVGQFTVGAVGLHEDGTVTLLHGTTRQNAEAIMTHGFQPGNPADIAAQMEKHYNLPEDSVLNHVAFQFAKGRSDLDRVHFTTDESVADQYMVPEVVQDGLTAVHMLLHPQADSVSIRDRNTAKAEWMKKEVGRWAEPAMLAVTVPWDVVGQHGFGKKLTLDEFKQIETKFKGLPSVLNNVSIPIEALHSAKIVRRKWDESLHPRDKIGEFATSGVPAAVQGTMFAEGLDPANYHEHALHMIADLDAAHATDPMWKQNVAAVQLAMSGFPMIHTAQLGNIPLIEQNGLHAAHEFGAGFTFDKISGLDRTVFMRMGQAGGGGHGAVGVMIDPKQLDPSKLIITRLGAMTLKAQEEALLTTPGDHRALVSEQLKPYRDGTIPYSDLGAVQSRLLVNGYITDHPDLKGKVIAPATIVSNDRGEMEVKYAGTIPPKALIAYFAGDQPLEKFEGKSAFDYLKDKVPAEKLVKYAGEGLHQLSDAYRAHYAATMVKKGGPGSGRYPKGSGAEEADDHKLIEGYLHGLCWPFAVALHRLYGFPMFVLTDPQEPGDTPIHAVVQNHGQYVDASGAVTLKELKQRYQLSSKAKLIPHTEEQINAIDPLKPAEIEAATAFIRRHDEEDVVKKADAAGRYVTPFVSFDKQAEDKLQLIASLNSSRLATWGFVAEADFRGITRYKLTAVLDGRTSKFCQMIDGTTFEVADARKKVEQVLDVQDPEDLRTVQPWPSQTNGAIAEFSKMNAKELTARGLHIPPFHPRCRTVCRVISGQTMNKQPEYPVAERIPQEIITQDTLRELGMPEVTPEELDQWNAYVGINPLKIFDSLGVVKEPEREGAELLDKAHLLDLAHKMVFGEDGDVGVSAKGTIDEVGYYLETILDPFTGSYYLTQADLVADALAGDRFIQNLFTGLIDTGGSIEASSLTVAVSGNAFMYARMGFLPEEEVWQAIRANALDAMENGSLQDMANSLAEDDRLLITHLLQDMDEHSMAALAELNLEYEGKTVGEWILENVSGNFSLDYTDSDVLQQAKEYLQ